MTAGEILASYRQAADKRSQIGILADLNAVTKGEIEEVLRQIGETLPEKKKARAGRPRKEPVRAEEEMPSLPAGSGDGSPREESAREEAEELPPEEPREAERMSAGTLAEILRKVAEAFPGTETAAEAGAPCGAELTVRWDAWGEIVGTRLAIQAKKETKETTIC